MENILNIKELPSISTIITPNHTSFLFCFGAVAHLHFLVELYSKVLLYMEHLTVKTSVMSSTHVDCAQQECNGTLIPYYCSYLLYKRTADDICLS